MAWYILHTLSGREEKVEDAIEHMIENDQIEGVDDVIVPYEKHLENVRGEKQTVKKKIYPGYVLINARLDSTNQHLLQQVKGVLDFVGSADRPKPMSEEEVEELFERMEEEVAEVETSYEVGDTVKVLDGPFADLLGNVKEIEPERRKVKIMVSIFGRETQVELGFEQVEEFETDESEEMPQAAQQQEGG